MRRKLSAIAGAVLIAAFAAPISVAAAPDRAEINANGNAFTGGLSFTPAQASVRVGGIAKWTNTDFLVPHTVTEKHNLFDLAGDYGGTPLTPAGFGPGESVQLVASAGTFSYYCRVHPTMLGVLSVPVRVSRKHLRGDLYMVVARWRQAPLGDRQSYDVQLRVGRRPWSLIESATDLPAGALITHSGAGQNLISFRARLRGPEGTSAYSPVSRTRLR
jgi:plastocyanin